MRLSHSKTLDNRLSLQYYPKATATSLLSLSRDILIWNEKLQAHAHVLYIVIECLGVGFGVKHIAL